MSASAPRVDAVGLAMKSVGKPDAGNPHVRFDERGRETGRLQMAQATAPFLDSTQRANATFFSAWAAGAASARPSPRPLTFETGLYETARARSRRGIADGRLSFV